MGASVNDERALELSLQLSDSRSQQDLHGKEDELIKGLERLTTDSSLLSYYPQQSES